MPEGSGLGTVLRAFAHLRKNAWSTTIVVLQIAILAALVMGVGQPEEVYAYNVPENPSNDAALSASTAADEARRANERLEQMAILGVRCSR